MRTLHAVADFWPETTRPTPAGFRLSAARSILACKEAMRDTLPAGLVYDPAVEILLSLYLATAKGGSSTNDAAAAAGLAPSVAWRWIAALAQQGLVEVSDAPEGQWAALSDAGLACATRAIDAVLDRQAALLS